MDSVSVPESLCSQLQRRIESRTARVGVVGMGYVGLPLALLLSEQRFAVTGFDVDDDKVKTLNDGDSYIIRILGAEIQSAQGHGFRATADYSMAAQMDVVIICVPTPIDKYRQPDTTYIVNTARALAPYLRPGQLIVLESTSYPRTTEEVLLPILEADNRLGLRASRAVDNENVFYLAFSPEREDPGRTDIERRNIPKVIGGLDTDAGKLASALYGSIFQTTVLVSNPATAEMTKLLENIYRCVNIALVNELKMLTQRMGIDIWEVIEAAKTKPFGFQAFYPGPGLGGHCIPVDPYYLSWKAKEFDFRTRFIELAGEINSNMPYHVVDAIADALNERGKSVKGAKVLVLGVAYKKDMDDLRESPSLTIIETLQSRGAVVSYHDPYFPFVGKGRHYQLEMKCATLDDIGEYDCVAILTDHSTYNYEDIVRDAELVIDTRNATHGLKGGNIVRC